MSLHNGSEKFKELCDRFFETVKKPRCCPFCQGLRIYLERAQGTERQCDGGRSCEPLHGYRLQAGKVRKPSMQKELDPQAARAHAQPPLSTLRCGQCSEAVPV